MFAAARAVGLGETMLVDFLGRRGVAFTGPGDRLRIHVTDLVKGVAERLANADRLAAQPGREMADRVVLDHVARDHAGASREPVAHHVRDELRPALPPEVFGHHRAVGIADQLANFLGAVGDAAMDFADAEYGMARARLAGRPTHLARRMQLDSNRARDRTQCLAPADDAGDRLLVHAVLQ